MSFVCVAQEYVSCPAQTLQIPDGTCAEVCNFAADSPCDEGFVCSPYFEGGAGDVGTCGTPAPDTRRPSGQAP